jgi:multiple sugar transport system substrate-binding protein
MDDFFTATGTDKSDFMPVSLESLQYGGSQILIPMEWFSTYLYWNKDIFKAAGLDPEKPPVTWGEIAEYAAKISDPARKVYGVGFCVSGGPTWFNSLFLANGGEVIDVKNKRSLFDSSRNLASLQYLQDAANRGLTPKGNTGADLDNLMMAGQLGMVINGPWMVPGLKNNDINFGVTSMPAGSAKTAGIAETIGFGVPAGTTDDAKSAAYKFIAHWNTTAVCKEWSVKNGFPPYLMSVARDPEIRADPLINVFANISSWGVTFGEGLVCTSQINADILFPLIENVIAGADCQAELTAAGRKIDALLATE